MLAFLTRFSKRIPVSVGITFKPVAFFIDMQFLDKEFRDWYNDHRVRNANKFLPDGQ
jgi:hypothetical protein